MGLPLLCATSGGAYFYEKQADGIGTYFLESRYSDIGSLINNAGIHPVCFGEYHRLLAERHQRPEFCIAQDSGLLVSPLSFRDYSSRYGF